MCRCANENTAISLYIGTLAYYLINKLKIMEFKSLKNIETSFKQIRLFGIVFLCLCAAITGYSVWSSYSFAEAQRQRIYVLDGGASRLCLPSRKTFHRTVPLKRGNTLNGFTNCSSRSHPIKKPLKAM